MVRAVIQKILSTGPRPELQFCREKQNVNLRVADGLVRLYKDRERGEKGVRGEKGMLVRLFMRFPLWDAGSLGCHFPYFLSLPLLLFQAHSDYGTVSIVYAEALCSTAALSWLISSNQPLRFDISLPVAAGTGWASLHCFLCYY